MNDKKTTIVREELFERVWSTPISILAREYGLSDVGLAKICKRMEVPRPERGYWQKLKVGKAPPRPNLKPLTAKGIDQVVISPTLNYEGSVSSGIESEVIPCPGKLNDPHPLVSKTIRAMKSAKIGERGILVPRNKMYLDIQVTKGSVERSCLIMDALVKAITQRDYELSIEKGDLPKTRVLVDGEIIEIGIDEKIRAVKHVLTSHEKSRYGGYIGWVPRFDHEPTGELILKIRNATYLGIRQSWGDGKVQKLENCLGKFIVGLHHAARAIKEHREERERREREWEERRQLWKEQQRLEILENQKIEKLSRDLENWKVARNIREYLVEIGNLRGQVEGLDEWISWANSYASRLDPTSCPENLVFKEANNEMTY